MVPLLARLYDDRKMCACSTKSEISFSPHHLGKGDSYRSPVASLMAALGFSRRKLASSGKSWMAHSRHRAFAAPANVWPFNHHWGAFSAPTNPIDQSLETCLSIWTEPCTNRPPFGYREQIAVQLRPTLRGLDAVSVSTLNPDPCFVSG